MSRPDLIPLKTCIHNHTFASDGNGSLDMICQAAAKEGVDCVIISDHETLGHNVNGYVGKVLVLTGEEVTPAYSSRINERGEIKGASDNNHLLVLGIEQAILNQGLPSQTLIDQASAQGGLTFLAHPREPGHPWEDFDLTGFTGFEIWTFKAAWKRGARKAPSKFYAWRNPDAVLDAPTEDELNFWDAAGRERRVVGIGSADNHAYRTQIDGIDRLLFPWETGMSSLLSVIWVEPDLLEKDPSAAVLSAIRAGRVLIAHHGLHPADGFKVLLQTVSGKVFWPGDSLPGPDGLQICVESPVPAILRVLRDGMPVYEETAASMQYGIDSPGVWRVEAALDGKAWIYTNPFYVGLW